jgi:DNA-binding NtrC family response regulator
MNGYCDVNRNVALMADEWWALLVYAEEEPVPGLQRILLDQGMRTRHVRNCSQTRAALREPAPPALVLTDTSLPDGTWEDVLKAASAAPTSAPVIVVSRLVDIKLYLDVLESGAYDFVVLPLTSADLAHIVRGAMLEGSHGSPGHRREDGQENL